MVLEDLLSNALSAAGTIYTIGVCALALWVGDRAQRLVATAALVAWLATLALLNRSDWISPQYAVFAVDAVLLVVLVGVALRSGRAWALWAAAFQLLGVLSHVTIAMDLRIRGLAYMTALAIWSLLVLTALLVGVISQRWRRDPMQSG